MTRNWMRAPLKSRKNARSPDPTPMDIARRSALIRSNWDDDTRKRRAGVGHDDQPVVAAIVYCESSSVSVFKPDT